MRPRESHGPLDAIPFFDVGGSGPDLIFVHANGYPPDCYRPLLRAFSGRYRTLAMHLRPLWYGSRPEAMDSWHTLSQDFLRFLTERELRRVVAVGHSLGAIVALRAALGAPDRFSALVLLDPVLMSKRQILQWRLLRGLRLDHRLQAKIRGAYQRRRVFADVEQAFQGYRHHAVFRYLSDADLRALVDGLTMPIGDALGLVYSPEWEARVYFTGVWNDWDLWKGLPHLAVPTLIVRGAQSDTFTEAASKAVQSLSRQVRASTVKQASHLVPLEQPLEVYRLARQFLDEVLEAPALLPAAPATI